MKEGPAKYWRRLGWIERAFPVAATLYLLLYVSGVASRSVAQNRYIPSDLHAAPHSIPDGLFLGYPMWAEAVRCHS